MLKEDKYLNSKKQLETGSALIMILIIMGVLGMVFAGNTQRFGWILGSEKRIYQKLLREATQRQYFDQISCSKTFAEQAENYECKGVGTKIDLINTLGEEVKLNHNFWSEYVASCQIDDKTQKKWLNVSHKSKKTNKEFSVFKTGRHLGLCYDYLNIGPRIVLNEVKKFSYTAEKFYSVGSWALDPMGVGYMYLGNLVGKSCPENYQVIGGGINCHGWNNGALISEEDYGVAGAAIIRDGELWIGCTIPAFSNLSKARAATQSDLKANPSMLEPDVLFTRKNYLTPISSDDDDKHYKPATAICLRCNSNAMGVCTN